MRDMATLGKADHATVVGSLPFIARSRTFRLSREGSAEQSSTKDRAFRSTRGTEEPGRRIRRVFAQSKQLASIFIKKACVCILQGAFHEENKTFSTNRLNPTRAISIVTRSQRRLLRPIHGGGSRRRRRTGPDAASTHVALHPGRD